MIEIIVDTNLATEIGLDRCKVVTVSICDCNDPQSQNVDIKGNIDEVLGWLSHVRREITDARRHQEND